jgi:uncharacterized protein (TIGR02172 family)
MKVAEGRTAEVFAWDDGRVLKLFRDGRGRDAAEYEVQVAQAIYASGAPAPRVDGVIEVGERAGVLYERIAGPSLLGAFFAQPWRLLWIARTFAEAHAAMHARNVAQLPELRGMLARRIRAATPLPTEHRDAALRALDALPDGDALCHGDYHAGNVLLSARGPLVIDWENAARGDPLFDVARALLLLDAGYLHASTAPGQALLRAAVWALRTRYLRRYCQLRPVDSTRLAAWRLPVAAARLCEEIGEEEAYLLARVRRLAEVPAASPPAAK